MASRTRAPLPDWYTPALPRVFGTSVLRSLARDGRSAALDELGRSGSPALRTAARRSTAAMFDHLYAQMRRSYRCEYVFKNEIARRLMQFRHGPHAAALVGELRADNCKADIVVVNGATTVYEVKSALDNLDRLPRQLAAYRKVFSRICVITDEGGEPHLAGALPGEVGIAVLLRGGQVITLREAVSGTDQVSPGAIFDTLRDDERRQTLADQLGAAPEVPNGVRYQVWRGLFETLSPEQAHDGLVRALRSRSREIPLALKPVLPRSLTAAVLTAPLRPAETMRLAQVLRDPYPPF